MYNTYLSRMGQLLDIDEKFGDQIFRSRCNEYLRRGSFYRRLVFFEVEKRKYYWVKIDASIYEFVRELNSAGFVTSFCCSGLRKDHHGGDYGFPYIGFYVGQMSIENRRHLISCLSASHKLYRIEQDDYYGGRLILRCGSGKVSSDIKRVSSDVEMKKFWSAISEDILSRKFKWSWNKTKPKLEAPKKKRAKRGSLIKVNSEK